MLNALSVCCCAIPSIRKALADLTPYDFATMNNIHENVNCNCGWSNCIYTKQNILETLVWKLMGLSFNVWRWFATKSHFRRMFQIAIKFVYIYVYSFFKWILALLFHFYDVICNSHLRLWWWKCVILQHLHSSCDHRLCFVTHLKSFHMIFSVTTIKTKKMLFFFICHAIDWRDHE